LDLRRSRGHTDDRKVDHSNTAFDAQRLDCGDVRLSNAVSVESKNDPELSRGLRDREARGQFTVYLWGCVCAYKTEEHQRDCCCQVSNSH
jgi:hypothetical protein